MPGEQAERWVERTGAIVRSVLVQLMGSTSHFQATVRRAVITVPATFDPLERDRVREAGRQAGFAQVELLAEPVAAALAFARDGLTVGRRVLVYDLGAGTFDLALLAHENGEFEPVLPPRGLRQGGDDFDQALYDHLERQAKQQDRAWSADGPLDLHLLRRCREIKENLSGSREVVFSAILPDGKPFKCPLSRATLETLIEPVVRQTVEETERMLAEAKAAGHEVDTVVLVGGSTRVPLVEERLRTRLPVAPVRWQRRDVAVALGAAYRAATMWAPPVPPPAAVRQPTPPPPPAKPPQPRVEPVPAAPKTIPINTVEDLVWYCETYTAAAERALRAGEFEQWLAGLGRGDLVTRAWKARISGEPNHVCLIWFLNDWSIEGGPGLAARLSQALGLAVQTPPTPVPSTDMTPSTVGAIIGGIAGGVVGLFGGPCGAVVLGLIGAGVGGGIGEWVEHNSKNSAQ